MAFTRFRDDPARMNKQNQISSYTGRYQLDAPGPGASISYFEDPQIRLEKWGANTMTNTINLESDLRGMTRKINRDLLGVNEHTTNSVSSNRVSFSNAPEFVEESRASHPAWMYKDLEHPRWENPWLDPLANLEKGFYDNINTRIIEKDNFIPIIPVIDGIQDDYYMSGRSICLGGNNQNCSSKK
jgi:hypothetical protein